MVTLAVWWVGALFCQLEPDHLIPESKLQIFFKQLPCKIFEKKKVRGYHSILQELNITKLTFFYCKINCFNAKLTFFSEFLRREAIVYHYHFLKILPCKISGKKIHYHIIFNELDMTKQTFFSDKVFSNVL